MVQGILSMETKGPKHVTITYLHHMPIFRRSEATPPLQLTP
jgi:hypothetical protein